MGNVVSNNHSRGTRIRQYINPASKSVSSRESSASVEPSGFVEDENTIRARQSLLLGSRTVQTSPPLPIGYRYKLNANKGWMSGSQSFFDQILSRHHRIPKDGSTPLVLLDTLIDHCPKNADPGAGIGSRHSIRGRIHNLFWILENNENVITAPNNEAERRQAYHRVKKVLGYIGYQLHRAYFAGAIDAKALHQAMDILGSGGQNCYAAYLESVDLICSHFRQVLELDSAPSSSLNDLVSKRIQSILWDASIAISQKLFDSFYRDPGFNRHLRNRNREAMRIHYRQHFQVTLNKNFGFHLPVHAIQDDAIDTQRLKSEEIAFIRKHLDSECNSETVFALFYQNLNDALSEDAVFYNQIIDWFHNRLGQPDDFVDILSNSVFDGFSKTIQETAAELLLEEFGFLKAATLPEIIRKAIKTKDSEILSAISVSSKGLKRHGMTAEQGSSLLSSAIRNNRDSLVRSLLATHQYKKEVDIQHLFRENRADRVSFLLKNGLDPNTKVPFENTAEDLEFTGKVPLLNLALAHHMNELAQELVKRGASCNAADQTSWRGFSDRDDDRTHNGRTPLHIAVNQGNIPMVRFLLEHRADLTATVDSFKKGMETPLDIALRKGSLQIARLLVAATGSRDFQKLKGVTKRIYDSGDMELFRLAVSRGATPSSCLQKVFERKDTDTIRFLLRKLDPNTKVSLERQTLGITFQDKVPLLNLVLAHNMHELAQELVERGASCNAADQTVGWGVGEQDDNGRTPLHIAVNQGSISMVRFLVEHKAKLTAKVYSSRYGMEAPVEMALRKGHLEIARLLIEAMTPRDIRKLKNLANRVHETGDTSLYGLVVTKEVTPTFCIPKLLEN